MSYFSTRHIALSIYLICGWIVFFGFQYELNPDGISYFSIAEKYASGDWQNAINGLWSPMLSWLLAPFAALGLPLPLTFKCLNLLIGANVVMRMEKLCAHYLSDAKVQQWVMGGVAIQTSFFALCITTPDLLSFMWALWYFEGHVKGYFYQNPLLAGLLGAMMYFSKAYFFFFFLLHQLLLLGIMRTLSPMQFLQRTLPFMLLSGLWIGCLSLKYETFTISTAARYNRQYIFDNKTNYWIGAFTPPPNKTAYFAWEDIVQVYPLKENQAMTWQQKGVFQVKRSTRNVLSLCKRLLYFHPLLIVALLIVAGRYIHKKSWIPTNFPQKWRELLLFSVLYCLGYTYFFWEDRYLWILILLGWLAVGKQMEQYVHSRFLRLCVLIISCLGVARECALGWKGDTHLLTEAAVFSQLIPKDAHIARWSLSPSLAGSQTWYYAFYNHWQDYGYIPQTLSTHATDSLLRAHDIQYVFIADTTKILPSFVQEKCGQAGGLSAFRVKYD